MAAETQTAKAASTLFLASMIVSMVGIFLGIFYLFFNVNLSIQITTVLLVGFVGVASFFRHSVFYISDQIRMGWKQEHPEFQLEVGYANLAIGIWAIVVVALRWGALACGITLAIYGTYLLCTLGLHIHEACAVKDIRHSGHRDRVFSSVISTSVFVLLLFFFAVIAFGKAGVVPAFM